MIAWFSVSRRYLVEIHKLALTIQLRQETATHVRHWWIIASHCYNKWFRTQWRSDIEMIVCLVVLPYSCIGLIIYAHSFVFICSFHYRVHGRVMLGAIKFERRQVGFRTALVICFWRHKVLAMDEKINMFMGLHYCFSSFVPAKHCFMALQFYIVL